MRIRSLVAGAVLVGLAALAVGVLIANAGWDREFAFYSQLEEFVAPDFLRSRSHEGYTSKDDIQRFLDDAHRSRNGVGTMFVYRLDSPGTSAMDDEHFRHLTLWLPNSPLGPELSLPLSDTSGHVAIYVSGASVWPELVCAGYVGHGHVDIRRIRGFYRVKVVGEMIPESLPAGAGRRCTREFISLSFDATETDFSRRRAGP